MKKIKIKKFLLNEFQKNKNLKSKTIPPLKKFLLSGWETEERELFPTTG